MSPINQSDSPYPGKGQKHYSIVTNSRGRRILVVNNLVNIENLDELEDSDFDAIYINIAQRTYDEYRLILRWLSPARVDKCFLKPRFAASSLEAGMLFARHLIDGFCESPLNDRFADFIEQIYANIHKYGIIRELNNDLSSSSSLLANIIKFDISRGRTMFTNHTISGMSSGYTSIFLAWYDNRETVQYDERMKFNLKLEELGYAEKSRFIDRVHTCPFCGHSHLLFIESCPKCNSSDINQESIIHHFRCANVSPESTYAYDGQLRCPKCKKFLRHIGVDYDRPATVYTCNSCHETFISLRMRVICANCHDRMTPEQLIPTDVWEYRLTQAGIRAFATDEALFQIESMDIYSGRSTFENFISSIEMFNNLISYQNSVLFVYRYHYEYEGDQEHWQLFDIMRTVISQMVTVKITTQDTNFYILIIAHQDKMAAEHDRVKTDLDQIFSEYTADTDNFTAYWLKTYKFTRGEDVNEFISQLTENLEAQINAPDQL